MRELRRKDMKEKELMKLEEDEDEEFGEQLLPEREEVVMEIEQVIALEGENPGAGDYFAKQKKM